MNSRRLAPCQNCGLLLRSTMRNRYLCFRSLEIGVFRCGRGCERPCGSQCCFFGTSCTRRSFGSDLHHSPVEAESCKANKVNPLTYLTYALAHARSKSATPPTPDGSQSLTWSSCADALGTNLVYSQQYHQTLLSRQFRTCASTETGWIVTTDESPEYPRQPRTLERTTREKRQLLICCHPFDEQEKQPRGSRAMRNYYLVRMAPIGSN